MGTVVATARIASQPAHPGPSLSADNSISINCVRSSSSGGDRGLIRKLADDLSLYILRIAAENGQSYCLLGFNWRARRRIN